MLSPEMSTHPHPKSEKRALADDDDTGRKSNLAKEFKHIKAGIWDVYEQIPHSKFGIDIPWISELTRNLEVVEDWPFFWRMVKDVTKIKSFWYHLSLFVLIKTLVSLQPAVTLWYVISHAIYF